MATDFSMFAGDTKQLAFAVVDSANAAVDVTGAGVKFVIAPQQSKSALVTKTELSGITISGSTITVALTPADTQALAGLYRYELEITDSSGNVSTNQGAILVQETVIA